MTAIRERSLWPDDPRMETFECNNNSRGLKVYNATMPVRVHNAICSIIQCHGLLAWHSPISIRDQNIIDISPRR